MLRFTTYSIFSENLGLGLDCDIALVLFWYTWSNDEWKTVSVVVSSLERSWAPSDELLRSNIREGEVGSGITWISTSTPASIYQQGLFHQDDESLLCWKCHNGPRDWTQTSSKQILNNRPCNLSLESQMARKRLIYSDRLLLILPGSEVCPNLISEVAVRRLIPCSLNQALSVTAPKVGTNRIVSPNHPRTVEWQVYST